MQSALEAVIFDVDGTLVDSVDLHAKAWQVAFAKFDRDVSFEAIRRQIGKGADQLLPVFFSTEELGRFGRELAEFRGNLFRTEYLPQIKPFPKVRELLRRIQDDGRKIALASSAKKDELDEYKKIARIEDLIEADTSSADVKQSKPHPDIFEAALSKLGDIALGEIVTVGDTPYDAEASTNANMRIIGLLSGGWTEERLRHAGCIEVYRHPADLLARYDQSILRSTDSPSARSDSVGVRGSTFKPQRRK
jgi:HAD superfamily hydrolase (TIGR01549 family)